MIDNAMLSSFINGEVSLKSIRSFCKSCIEMETEPEERKDLRIHTGFFPILANGFILIPRCNVLKTNEIFINASTVLFNSNLNTVKKYFYTFVTLYHELMHQRILRWHSVHDYPAMLAFWEEYRNMSFLRFTDAFSKMITKDFHSSIKRRAVAMSEIECTYQAYARGYQIFYDHLSEDDRSTLKTVLDSLQFVRSNLAIVYGLRNQHPYSSFVRMIQEVQAVQKTAKDKQLLPDPMRVLFFNDGSMKNLEMLLESRNAENCELLDKLIINLFICTEYDYSAIFEGNLCAKEVLTGIANRYRSDAIGFIRDIDRGSIFLTSGILNDNAAMLIKKMARLDQLMDQYQMERTGGIIPLYRFTA